MTVFVLIHEFEYQKSVTVHTSRAAAEAFGRQVAKEDWPELGDLLLPDRPDAEFIDRYTQRGNGCSLEIYEAEMEPEAKPRQTVSAGMRP